ncbi:MAG: hypothetical protein P1P84_05175 [Deferrisomatales bacterium]|nr:hypothetical protein [Deferrisomatales bacterium]
MRRTDHVRVLVQTGDAFDIEGDVLALKYEQDPVGIERSLLARLKHGGIDAEPAVPVPGAALLLKTAGATRAPVSLLIGVRPVGLFGYQDVREFTRAVLVALAGTLPNARHLLLTIHGAGGGLDEHEALESGVAGLVEAIQSGECSPGLRKVTVVEKEAVRATLFKRALDHVLPDGAIPRPGATTGAQGAIRQPAAHLRSVGYDSASKPNIFVAMPFRQDMEDLYHYGIQGAVRAAGFVCERSDLSTFTGEVMSWIKQRIETASLVIADLTHANPNVYLEVGYAWGRGRPTVLLVQDEAALQFDVRGQRCLTYSKIKDLEEKLTADLKTLREGPA